MAFVSAIFLLLIFSISPLESASQSTLTAYEVLQEYDFPVGILPNGVTGYKLNNSTGRFSVYLNGTCTFKVESYELQYEPTIKGVIDEDKLSRLEGIKVKVFLFWLSITEVTRDDEDLEFSVGIASPDFPVSNFDESPTCGCGFDCDNHVSSREKKLNTIVSS
ncbi:hypothetical protein Tsubulata_021562 [Turnera subulata]|uniref:DUF538 domain-containing protein n=1 Tax=Turnera subulata TaxID=218843 RepID=A0A9Q0GHS5_9ROSI|nr:hypothetical protein Tsubulata_021562 [Turnera subulata]